MTETLRSTVTHLLSVADASGVVEWTRQTRGSIATDSGKVEAQAYYLYLHDARSGWLSPKGVEEYVEVLPRRLSLLDEVFRATEAGQILANVLVDPEEWRAWREPLPDRNPFHLTPEHQYFLLYAILGSDGDFLIPWMSQINDGFHSRDFDYLEAGALIPTTLAGMADAFEGVAFLDADRQQLASIRATRKRVEEEIATRKEREGSGSRRDQIAVPRLEWMVDLGILSRRDPDALSYRFSANSDAIVTGIAKAYETALVSSFSDQALDRVLDDSFATHASPLIGARIAELRTSELVSYLLPAYEEINSISGYCRLRTLNVLATIMSARNGSGTAIEYRTALQLLEERYKEAPDSLEYTVDRLSTDYQVRLFAPAAGESSAASNP